VVAGTGAALLLAGAITGGLAIGKKSVVNANCSGLVCNHTGETAVNAGRAFGTASTVGLSLGAVGLATGAVLYFTAKRPPRIEQKAARWEGGIAASPDGVSIRVKGAW
jgi:hypothetical protein